MKRKLCFLVIILILTGSYIVSNRREALGASPPKNKTNEELFLLLQRGNDLTQRRKAAKELAQRQDANAWIVLVLQDENCFNNSNEELKNKLLKEFDRTVLAELLENISADANNVILLAVIHNLSNKECGEYSSEQKIGPFTIMRASCGTEPIKEIARDTLKRCLKCDYGYDEIKWKQEILRRMKIGGVATPKQ